MRTQRPGRAPPHERPSGAPAAMGCHTDGDRNRARTASSLARAVAITHAAWGYRVTLMEVCAVAMVAVWSVTVIVIGTVAPTVRVLGDLTAAVKVSVRGS